MKYEIDIDYLKTSQTKLDGIKSKVDTINTTYTSSLNKLSNTEIGTISNKLKNNLQRLQKGYTNSNNWLKKYNQDVENLENGLASFNQQGLTSPIEFKGEFIDLYGKQTMSNYKTGAERTSPIEETTEDSGVLSYQVGTVPEDGKEAANIARLDSTGNGRATLLDIKVNGVSLGQDGTITIKKGQQVKLDVSFPDGIEVQTLKRTSAHGQSDCFDYVNQYSNPSVNKKDSSTYANVDHYTWYITGKKTGTVTLSQTALWTLTGNHRYSTYKGMARVKVKIVD